MIASSAQVLADRVAAATSRTARPLIALDHDGTLSPIAPRPDDAVLAVGAASALHRLAGHADLAIVSGRGLDDLRRRFTDHHATLIGEHGMRCRLPDGTVEQLAPGLPPATLERLGSELHALLEGRPGWLIEDKGVAIAVHHRRVPPDALHPTLERVHELLQDAARDTAEVSGSAGGDVLIGKSVLEIRPAGADKGSALRWLAARSTARPVVMVGDDVTDEPALLAAEELGGVGVLVAEESSSTSASARLRDPDEVIVFLDLLATHLESSRK